jgi:inhibitor of KinA
MAHWRKSSTGEQLVFDLVKAVTEKLLGDAPPLFDDTEEAIVTIPVCYAPGFGPDLSLVAEANQLSTAEVINIHLSRIYRVYLLGFLPGFCYLGELEPTIAMPRKPQPVPVAGGAIGIAGRQTGIYPMASPGGWQIIGRTPLKVFDANRDELTLLKAGDKVRFSAIDVNEFDEIQRTLNVSSP